MLLFQFTPLCERLQASWWRFSTQPLVQFTPLCERLRSKFGISAPEGVISIHASLREATRWLVTAIFPLFISIHASLREATKSLVDFGVYPEISIHASLREATLWCLELDFLFGNFNSRLSTRGYLFGKLTVMLSSTFQFTPLYERLHADRENFMCMEDISIHASLREATHGHCAYCGCLLISIHASLREATCSRYQSSRKKQISIHASLREATYAHYLYVGEVYDFNSRLSTRGYGDQYSERGRKHISIHASLREATESFSENKPDDSISIHASLREATDRGADYLMDDMAFQFTPLCERLLT